MQSQGGRLGFADLETILKKENKGRKDCENRKNMENLIKVTNKVI
jgi:hypothetical protein